jgi:hydrogenase nickel incorporation protein HypB
MKPALELKHGTLVANQRRSEQIHQYLLEHQMIALSIVSAPDAGLTTLLEWTVAALETRLDVVVIKRPPQICDYAGHTHADATSEPSRETNAADNLDAHWLGETLTQLNLPNDSLILMENRGGLGQPLAFGLGETYRVIVLAAPGSEKLIVNFEWDVQKADLLLLNKIDRVPCAESHIRLCTALARQINPAIQVLPVSATRGDGMNDWLAWIERWWQRLP